jgi:hypothetical protein
MVLDAVWDDSSGFREGIEVLAECSFTMILRKRPSPANPFQRHFYLPHSLGISQQVEGHSIALNVLESGKDLLDALPEDDALVANKLIWNGPDICRAAQTKRLGCVHSGWVDEMYRKRGPGKTLVNMTLK